MPHKKPRPPPGGRADDALDPAAWPAAVDAALSGVLKRQAQVQAATSAAEAPRVEAVTDADLDAAVRLWREVMPAPLRGLVDAGAADEHERRTA